MTKIKRPKVYTFHSQSVPDLELVTRRIELWRQNWKDAGYEPIVLNAYSLPARGAIATKHVSFCKWFALLKVAPSDEFFMFVGYTVFNYGFVPDMHAGQMASKGVNVFFEQGTSNVMFMGRPGLQKQCDMFGHYTPPLDVPTPGAKMFTDVDVLKHQETNAPELSVTCDVCRTHSDVTGWENSKLVRFDDWKLEPKALRDWNAERSNPAPKI